MSRKASAEDLQYLRRDCGYMAQRDEMEGLRSDLDSRFDLVNGKINAKEKHMRAIGDNIEAKLEQRLNE